MFKAFVYKVPPTYTDPPMPTPPTTVKAPLEVEVEAVVGKIFIFVDVIATLLLLLILK